MDINTRFDRAIEVRLKGITRGRNVITDVTQRSPSDLKAAAIFVVDTLDLAWLGAQAVLETKAKPEHAIAIFDRIVDRLDKMPACDREQFEATTEPETKPHPVQPPPPPFRLEQAWASPPGAA